MAPTQPVPAGIVATHHLQDCSEMRRARSSLYPWVPILRAQDTKHFRYKKVKAYQIEGRHKEKDETKQLRAQALYPLSHRAQWRLKDSKTKHTCPKILHNKTLKEFFVAPGSPSIILVSLHCLLPIPSTKP